MKVLIKSFDVGMQVKAKGIEFEVRTPDDQEQLGDCYLNMVGLIWCKGRIQPRKGIKVSWKNLMAICQSDAAVKAAVEAANASATPSP